MQVCTEHVLLGLVMEDATAAEQVQAQQARGGRGGGYLATGITPKAAHEAQVGAQV